MNEFIVTVSGPQKTRISANLRRAIQDPFLTEEVATGVCKILKTLYPELTFRIMVQKALF